MRPKVFIVDDLPDVRCVFSEMLAALGCQVRAFPSAAACLEALQQETPDVALFDVQMPEMNGLDLVRQVRARGYQFPIYLVTAYCTDVDRFIAQQIGAVDVVPKPLTMAMMQHLVSGGCSRTALVATRLCPGEVRVLASMEVVAGT